MIIRPALSHKQEEKTRPRPTLALLEQQALSQPTKQAPHFGGPVNNGLSTSRKLLNRLDYRDFGSSSISQIQLIYAGCIGWRLVAANQRRKESPTKSWNEVRENALRDSMGYLFWFFATPILQRGILAYVTKKYDPSIGNSLYQINQDVANGKGVMGKLKAWNPLYRVNIPTSDQVKNQKKQALAHLTEGTEAYKKAETFYNKLSKYRNIATGLGLINTILLIGILINLLNFYLTRKNMERRQAAFQRPQFPNAPTLEPPKPATTTHATDGTQVSPQSSANSTGLVQPSLQANPATIAGQAPSANPWVFQQQATP
jgi:hypothetical protein